jgi:AcrR family transcriptional regulator
LLLESARRRFARDGYAATAVRDIANDAGVNVALVNRYFASKEGLFEACLTSTVEELRGLAGEVSLGQLPRTLAQQTASVRGDRGTGQTLMLLLRSSGDERADQIRLDMLRSFSQALASAAGGQSADPDTMRLRAQLVLAVALGTAVLRSFTGLEPIASTSAEDLIEPLTSVVEALLRPASQPAPDRGA